MKHCLITLLVIFVFYSDVIGSDLSLDEIVEPIPYAESFETGFGSWVVTSGNSIWTRQSGSTPSGNTGPTAASDGSYYLFTEASGSNNNQVAIIEGPAFLLSSQSGYEFSFDHHMYGVNMGTLKLEISTNGGGTWIPLWTLSGPQDNGWLSSTIDLANYIGQTVRLRFHATVGSSYTSDMAIDNLSLNEVVGSSSLSCSQVISTFPYSESFEGGEGLWIETSTLDIWRRRSGSTGSGQTGPSSASNGSYYMYTEASGANYPNKKGYFEGPCFDFSQVTAAQLSFSYHMYGNRMGTLHVEIMSDDNPDWQVIWSRTGESGTVWYNAAVDLGSFIGQSVKIRFYGLTGTGFRSDMAIDDVKVMASSPQYPVGCNETITDYPYLESFESGWGLWSEKVSNNIWRRSSGGTPSGNTGPSGAIDGSYYLYVEASSPNYPKKTAILEGPCFNLSGAYTADFTFQYSMLGSQVGQIRLEVSTDNGANWNSVWLKEGNQGSGPQSNSWYFESIDLASYLGKKIKLRFRAITGDGYAGDMAIDDIQFDVLKYNPSGLYQARVVHLGSTDYDHSTLVGAGVQNVLVEIDNQDNSSNLSLVSNANGYYNTTFGSGEKTIVPSTQDVDWLNGVTSADVNIIAGHAQGYSVIEDPLKRLAADVDGDGVITMDDVYMIQDLIVGNINEFPNGENWRFVSNIFLKKSQVHPDKVFSADFWNNSVADVAGNQYPFKASLRYSGERYAYDGATSWINSLSNFFVEASSNCETPADFVIIKMGDVNGTANSAGFPYPSGPSSLGNSASFLSNSLTVDEDLPLASSKSKKQQIAVSIYASSRETIHSFELGLWYDQEMFTLNEVVKGSADLRQNIRRNFTSESLRSKEVVKTVWLEEEGEGRRFEVTRDSEGLSKGKLLMKVVLDASIEKGDVSHGIRIDRRELKPTFYGAKGERLEDVDLELVIEKADR